MKISNEDFETLNECLGVFNLYRDVFYEMYPNGIKKLTIFLQNIEMTKEDARVVVESLINKKVQIALDVVEKYDVK